MFIDSGKQTTAQAELDAALAGRTTLQKAIADFDSRINSAAATQTPPSMDLLAGWKRDQQKSQDELNILERTIDALKEKVLAAESQGFFKDILSDGNGVGLHRFQIFVWTLVLGVVFIATIVSSLTMPSFSETLLGLLGISGATYLGFKFPEPGKP